MKNQKNSLVDKLLEDMFPSESLDASYFEKEFWSLDEFCALMSGISPERFIKIMDNEDENLVELDIKRCLEARNLHRRFLKQLDEIRITEKAQIRNNDFCMSPWKFIKWAAQNGIPIKNIFIHSLPLYLLEIYLEFAPDNSPLRTQSKYSRAYHKALYLKNAREIRKQFTYRPSREEIYSHPHMQNVLWQIRNLRGNYKKRTIIDSWFPKIEKLKRGRPRVNFVSNLLSSNGK